MKIAFLQFGARGDILYSTPIFRQVRVDHPKDEINWHIQKNFSELIRYNFMIDNIVEWDLGKYSGQTKQDKEKKMWADMKKHAEANYDKVIKPQYYPDCLIPWDCKEDFLTMMAKCAGIDKLAKRDILVFTTSDIVAEAKDIISQIKRNREKVVAINHYSYTNLPVWDLNSYGRLFQMLNNQGIKVIFSSGPSDPFPSNIPSKYIYTGPMLVWKEMIELSDLWIGLDAGTMALACSTRTPIITLRHPQPYPLSKTGILQMGLRTSGVVELIRGETDISVENVMKIAISLLK